MSPRAVQAETPDGGPLEPIAICGMACRLPGGVDSESSFWKMLVEKRTGQTAKVPESRFNIDAHLHENLSRPGSFNVPGGYFLDNKPEDFDPTFFNITPVEAQWLDPQQRRMLEVSYECLTSAGLTLDEISGTNTAVYVGSFTSDYQQMSTREPDFRHNYAATGVDTGIISNRIGNTFNLNGPSFTINTACSSSVYAIHNASHALRARDCDAAIVGGVNLIITVDQHMNTAKLGILSPTSTCHTFDASADGYGRAEAAGAIYLKRLSDAIRCGDPIRGVIRATAVNTNGKVPGMGITHPSVKGQERVVRLAYEKAGLDPNHTAYAELHGTGTPVGDPIEVRAISNALNDTRSKKKPLIIGALKPNIGHSEAASGISAVMKAALMTESGVIPGVALLNKLNPAIHEEEWNVKVNRETSPWPSEFPVRRASVSSFGYGGTNGHVVVEAVESLYPWYRHAKSKRDAQYDHSTKRPVLVCLSAHDKPTLGRVIKSIAGVAADYYGIDLAHTLNLHRTAFNQRAFTVLREGQEAIAFDANADVAVLRTGAAPAAGKTPELAFMFTGQGAQWAGMGRVAMSEFPIFAEVIHNLDRVLGKVTPVPSFKLADVLLDDPVNTEKFINQPDVAQPLCTAIQIAMVDLLSQWDIEPVVSVGHSSGEIASAYAAGLISAPEAIIAAYCRGYSVQWHSGAGSMLAVGLGADEASLSLPSDASEACIACENSPQSVTISGRSEAIAQLRDSFTAKGVFARELKTGRAYHSPHMADVAVAYEALLEASLKVLSEEDRQWHRERSEMISSVTGERVIGNHLAEGYFSMNLRQRVRFSEAVQKIGNDDAFSKVRVAVEIGPHSALAGPFKQICKAGKFERFTYVPSMVRNKDDADQLLSVAGSMFLVNYPLRLEEVNAAAYDEQNKSGFRKPRTQYLLVDLPPYPWNYEKSHWAEPRASAEQRHREYPRHDLLGSRISGLSSGMRAWRNVLRVRDVPWLRDHSLGESAIFPAAGYITMAIEAARQVHEHDGDGLSRTASGVTLQDVDIKTTLNIPDSEDEGVETLLTLQSADSTGWYSFTIESCSSADRWTLHCDGRVRVNTVPSASQPRPTPVDEKVLGQQVSGKRWYEAFERVGFHYGPSFQQLQRVHTGRDLHQAAGDVIVRNTSGLIQGESRALIHPSTVDACLHLVIISIHAGKYKEMPWGVVPTRIEEVTIVNPEPSDVGPATGRAVAWSEASDRRHFNTNVQLVSQSNKPLLEIRNLTCVAYEAAVPVSATEVAPVAPFSTSIWKPDVSRYSSADGRREAWTSKETNEPLGQLVELVAHRKPVSSALITGSPAAELVDIILDQLPTSTTVKIGFVGDEAPTVSQTAEARVIKFSLPPNPETWIPELKEETFDLIFSDSDPKLLMPLVNEEGWVLGTVSEASPTPSMAITTGNYFALQKAVVKPDTSDVFEPQVLLLSFKDVDSNSHALAKALESSGSSVTHQALVDCTLSSNVHVIVDDTDGYFFSALDRASFDALKKLFGAAVPVLWLTKGVQQGRSATGGMAGGFLRVLCSEMAASRIVLLDYDEEESLDVVSREAMELVKNAGTRDSGNDTEFWLHKGVLHISRLVPNDVLNRQFEGGTQTYDDLPLATYQEGQPMRVRVLDGGDLGLEPLIQETALAADEVEIQLFMSQRPDSSPWGTLVMGVISRTGDDVTSSLIGKEAVGIVTGDLTTAAQTSVFATVNSGREPFDRKSLLGTLGVIAKIVDLTLNKAQVLSGDPVLALPGPEIATKLLVKLASARGWNLALATRSQEEKQNFESLSVFDGVRLVAADDIEAIIKHLESKKHAAAVLAYDFINTSREVWRRIPASGRFMLLNSETGNLAPDAAPFARGASFITTPASSVPSRQLLERCIAEIQQHQRFLLQDDLTLGYEQDCKMGIIDFSSGESLFKMIPPTMSCCLSDDAAYLLVGCLGGLGRSLTKRMMELGARNFVFVSRSGADKTEAAQVVEEIKKAGASADVFRADVSDEVAIRKVIDQVVAKRQIRGVVHAAMVLKDGMFEQMDYDTFEASISPKARGAVSLHNALQDVPGIDLDFFVLTSSISALLGNTGQSNYGAANGVLESLARFRSGQGLPATALALPMVLGVGVVAETDGLEASLMRKGLYGIDENEMIRGFEVAMARGRTSGTVFMGMEAPCLGATITSAASEDSLDLYWYRDARFSHVRNAVEATGKQKAGGSSGGGESFRETVKVALKQEGYDGAVRAIAKHIAKRVSIILMIAVEDIELDGPSIASYGLDSMIGVEMRTWLFKEFGLNYPFQQLLAPTLSFTKLGSVVAETMGLKDNELV
ncbi:polyketide synthase [Colletotrichum truncatum]|uniref:Polyketide synthase n=1 Tax=Colletotrichum truncatum TaxID=5467 RepID=A0ACC3YD50_COLTU